MSRYGMFLPMRQLKAKGTLLVFEIFLANKQRIFKGEGEVITTYSPPQHSIPGIGIRFTALDEWSHQLLEQILHQQFPLSPLVPQLAPAPIQVMGDGEKATREELPAVSSPGPAVATIPSGGPIGRATSNRGSVTGASAVASPRPHLPLFFGSEEEIPATGPIIASI